MLSPRNQKITSGHSSHRSSPSRASTSSPARSTTSSGDAQYPLESNLIHPILERQTAYYNEAFQSTSASAETLEIPTTMSSPAAPRKPVVSIIEVTRMLESLQMRRVNTLTEIRRIEKALIPLPAFSSEYCSIVMDAWNHYVNSNNFLNELRSLTRQYPFSAELLVDAKIRVLNDPNSARSWNFVWLLLWTMRNK